MKNTFIITLFYILLFNQNSNSQCDVNSEILENGTTHFTHAKEEIYDDDDYSMGISTAFISLIVIQHPTNKDLLKMRMCVDVAVKDKQMVVPRQIKIYFTDETTIELMAETVVDVQVTVSGVYDKEGIYFLKTDDYTTLQTKSISKIIIIDNRENNQLICTPYKDILKEQANCIALKLQ